MRTTTERERVLRAFLEEGLTELPDWVYAEVRTEIDRLPQRRPIRGSIGRIAIAAALVAAVLVANWSRPPAPNTPAATGGALATTTTTPASSASSGFPPAGQVSRGHQIVTLEGVRASINILSEGWISDGRSRLEHMSGGGGVTFWRSTPDGIYADPCAHVPERVAEPSIDRLSAAAARIAGTTLVSGPSAVDFNGHPARLVVLTLPASATCGVGDPGFYLWYDDVYGGQWLARPGDTIRAWIIDVNGLPVWVDGETVAGADPIVGQDIQQVIDSIQFE